MAHAGPDGALLTGTVKSAAGEKMGGVTVSAKLEERPSPHPFLQMKTGSYYFPAMASGQYEVWAQADGVETARGERGSGRDEASGFRLKPPKDFERQLTGDQMLASLPDQTPDDRRLKRVFRNSCTSCHQPNYILQNSLTRTAGPRFMEFDEARQRGRWISGRGQPDRCANRLLHEKELAPYLARARGPEPSGHENSKCARALPAMRRAWSSPNMMCR